MLEGKGHIEARERKCGRSVRRMGRTWKKRKDAEESEGKFGFPTFKFLFQFCVFLLFGFFFSGMTTAKMPWSENDGEEGGRNLVEDGGKGMGAKRNEVGNIRKEGCNICGLQLLVSRWLTLSVSERICNQAEQRRSSTTRCGAARGVQGHRGKQGACDERESECRVIIATSSDSAA